jgi:CHAD domain-containing protein
MEVFADCFEERFRTELDPAVEEMQEILGSANDSIVAAARLEQIRARAQASCPNDWKRYRPGVETLLRQHRQRLPRQRERFLEWWQHWQRDGGEAALTGLLKTAAV